MPPFPARYFTSSLIGRVDLVDVLSLEEYHDTVPDALKEQTTSAYLFVTRNPKYLEMLIRMTGQPSIYKMPKEVFIGAKPLLKPVEYSWWPPRQYANSTIGQFDIYPAAWDHQSLTKLL
jgi:hypothetical protein